MANKVKFSSSSSVYERMEEVRKDFGITKVDFCEILGMSVGTYRHYKLGQCTFSEANIVCVCKRWNVKADWLLLGRGKKYVGY